MALKPYPFPQTPKFPRTRSVPAFPTINEPIKFHLLHSLPPVQTRSVCKMNGSEHPFCADFEMNYVSWAFPRAWVIVTLPAVAPVASRTSLIRPFFKPLHCAPLEQLQQEVDSGGIMCEPCNGKGWLLCDFCKGQKTNVKGDNNRIYRRCPSCRAIGYLLCSKCKVFKCVTFPNGSDGEELTF